MDIWAARLPQANYDILAAGAGPGPTVAAGIAYVTQASHTEAIAGVSMGGNAALSASWQGPASIGNTGTSIGLNTAMQLLAGWLAEKPPVISTAVEAFMTAFSTMIPSPVCDLNREWWALFCAWNPPSFGAFTPAIVASDMEYFGHFWTTNASAGTAYSLALMGLMAALAIPPPIAAMGGSPAAPAQAAAAVAENAVVTTASEAVSAPAQVAKTAGDLTTGGGGEVMQAAQSFLQPVQSLAGTFPQLLQGFAGMPMQFGQSLMSSAQGFMGMFNSLGNGGNLNSAVSETSTARAATLSTTGLGPTAGTGTGPVGGVGTPMTPGLTNYTRPVSSFNNDNGGRPSSLAGTGLLDETARNTTTRTGTSGMPMAPGMLGRQGADSDSRDETSRARIVLAGHQTEDR